MKRFHDVIDRFFEAVAEVVYRFRWLALVLCLVGTGVLGSQIPRLEIDTRDESFFHPDDPALVSYNAFRETFGQSDAFIIAMRPRDGLTPRFLATMVKLHRRLEAEVPHLDEISSLVNARVVRGVGDVLEVEDLMEEPPADEAGVERLLEVVDHYPMYEGLLISRDRGMVSILVSAQAVRHAMVDPVLEGFDDFEPPGPDLAAEEAVPDAAGANDRFLSNAENREIATVVNTILADFADEPITFYFAGTPAIVVELEQSIQKDMQRMVPRAMLLVLLVLALLFRRPSGVVLPMIVVSCSLVSTFGIMALIGLPVTHVTNILPTFLLVVGVADSVHLLAIFLRRFQVLGDRRRAVVEAAGLAGLPILMTSVTTAAGLMSFLWADVAIVAQLGMIAPVGIMLACFYSVVLLIALIAVVPVRQPRPRATTRLPHVDRFFDALAGFTCRRPLAIVLVSAVLVALSMAGAASVRFSHNALSWFPEGSPTRTATHAIDAAMGGTTCLEVLVDTGVVGGLYEPEVEQRLDELAAKVAALEVEGIRVAKAWSLAEVVKETNRALNQDRQSAYALPASRQLIAQELLLFESSGSDDLEDFTETRFQVGRFTVLLPFADAILLRGLAGQIETLFAEAFPGATVTLTGHTNMFISTIGNVISSMAKSYGAALVAITLLMLLIIGRIRVGMLSMVANVVPILAVLGLMGLRGMPMDFSNILVGSIALGLVVDDTIHFLHHFRRALDEGLGVEAAVRRTYDTAGRAMVITSVVLGAGFFLYLDAYMVSSARFGLLTGCAVVFALVADLVLLPAILYLVYGGRTVAREEAAINPGGAS